MNINHPLGVPEWWPHDDLETLQLNREKLWSFLVQTKTVISLGSSPCLPFLKDVCPLAPLCAIERKEKQLIQEKHLQSVSKTSVYKLMPIDGVMRNCLQCWGMPRTCFDCWKACRLRGKWPWKFLWGISQMRRRWSLLRDCVPPGWPASVITTRQNYPKLLQQS